MLDRAGVRSGTIEILVEGADRGKPKDGPPDIPFARSMPLEKAMHPDTLLAFELNGEPMPIDHGAPLRLVVPSWYGMAGVKWVARIEALTEPFTGYYQKNRYIYDYGDGNEPTPVTTMRVKSIITSPHDGGTVAVGPVVVRGKAWSGEGTITRVEVAVDGGENWGEARLLPAQAEYGWSSWEFTWEAGEPGRHALRVRAADSSGNVQPVQARWNKYGYCSNAIQVVAVNTR